MAVRVLLQFATPSMQLAQPIWDSEGKPAAGQGSYLREPLVRLLRSMGLHSALVDRGDDLTPWQTVRELEAELLELDARFGAEPGSKPGDALHQAIGRYLTRRAERLAAEPS